MLAIAPDRIQRRRTRPASRDWSEASDWIVRIAQQRDKSAFEALFLRFAPRVQAYLTHGGTPHAVAEELTQDTFLTVWRKAGRFDPSRASAAAWIYVIARNARIDRYRHDLQGEALRYADADAAPETPEQRLGAVEVERRVRRALTLLRADQLNVLSLAFLEDLSHAEIADELGLPLGTVKSRIRLAIGQLRSSLGDQD